MAIATGPTFYLTQVDQDQAFGVDVRQLQSVIDSGTTFTLTFTGSGTYYSTVDPYTNKSDSNYDAPEFNYGWALNVSVPPDQLAASQFQYRKIPGGTWNVYIPVSVSGQGGGLLGASASGTIQAMLYKIASGVTGADFLAQGTASVNQGGLLGGTTTDVQISFSEPEFILAEDETILIALRIESGQAAGGALGGAADAVFTIGTGSGQAVDARVVLPGEIMYVYNRDLADSVPAVSDSVDRVAAHPRTLNDSAPAADSVARVANYYRPIEDTAPPVVDDLQRVANHPRTLMDTIAVFADSLIRSVQYGRALEDSAPASDSLGRVVQYNRFLTDSIPVVADTLLRHLSYYRLMEDSIPEVIDSLVRLYLANRSLSDTSTVVDFLERTATYSRHLEDAIPAVADSLIRNVSYNRSLADAIPAVIEQLERYYIANRSISDVSPTVADEIQRAAEYNRSLSDAIPAVMDQLTRQVTYRRYLEDKLSEGGGGTTIIKRPIILLED